MTRSIRSSSSPWTPKAPKEKTTNVYQKLIEEEKVIAIVGPDSSKCMLAAAPIAQNAKCPAITTFGTNTAVTEVGNYIFRACFIDPFQGSVAAAYCDQQGYRTACIMFNNADAYAVGLKDAFVENFKGEVLAIEEYSGSDVKDYNVQLTKLAAQQPRRPAAPEPERRARPSDPAGPYRWPELPDHLRRQRRHPRRC